MGYTPYPFTTLVPDDVDLTLDEVHAALLRSPALPDGHVVRIDRNQIEVRGAERPDDPWRYHLGWEDAPWVPVESAEMADSYARDRADRQRVAGCPARIVCHGDPDPDMVFFNTYLLVRRVLEALPDVYLLDELDEKLWRSGEEHGT